jgi:hypothetical protein
VPASDAWGRLYCNVSLIDCESKEILDELLAALPPGRFVIRRLSDRTIIVDGQQKTSLSRLLARRGQPFRIVDLPPTSPEELREAGGP